MVQRLGAEIKQGVSVGKDVSVTDLLSKHDLIFVGVGLGGTGRLNVPGDDMPHVHEALAWIEALKTAPEAAPRLDGKRALIVGGGNTAIDAVTQARRLGAEATLVYRRSESKMSAYRYEIELARSMGCALLFHRSPARVESVGLVVSAPHGGEELLPADLIIAAIGQSKRVGFLRDLPGVALDDKGRVGVDKKTHQTANPRIYAGGDCVNGGKEAVNAVAEGKAAARAMHKALGF
jgi:glutamate synthase (NADPH/NADH) small chain